MAIQTLILPSAITITYNFAKPQSTWLFIGRSHFIKSKNLDWSFLLFYFYSNLNSNDRNVLNDLNGNNVY